MVYSIAWNEATPAGSTTNANTIDTEFHNLKTSIKERMNDILSNAWETDASDPKLLDPAALATYPIGRLDGTPQVAVLHSTVTLTVVSGVLLVLLWDGETLDTGGFHSTSSNTNRITIPASGAGYYRITAHLSLVAGAAATDVTLSLRKGGTIIRTFATPTISGDSAFMTVSEIVLAAVTDIYDLTVSQASGVNLSVVGGVNRSSFSIEKLNGTT